MIDFRRLESSLYTEPYEPYVHCGVCWDCIKDPDGSRFTRYKAEGKEEGFKLYVRFVCPINPAHNGKWSYHCKRPLKFRIKKTLKRFISKCQVMK